MRSGKWAGLGDPGRTARREREGKSREPSNVGTQGAGSQGVMPSVRGGCGSWEVSGGRWDPGPGAPAGDVTVGDP